MRCDIAPRAAALRQPDAAVLSCARPSDGSRHVRLDSSRKETMSRHRVVLLPGDGIGPEVVEAARRVVDASGPEIEWLPMEIGAVAFEKYGDALPAHVLDQIRACGVALKGPTTTRIATGYAS